MNKEVMTSLLGVDQVAMCFEKDAEWKLFLHRVDQKRKKRYRER